MKRFDVFLSHSGQDKADVESLALRLKLEGIEPFLDKWNVVPGELWQPALEKALDHSSTCAVFIGPSGVGPWQNEEMRAAVERRVTKRAKGKGAFRVIPVLLPGGRRDERSRLPAFLSATSWVEFRNGLDDKDAFYRLLCGVRGKEPGAGPAREIDASQCPYRGLEAFEERHAHLFFGREVLVEWILDSLRPVPGSVQENRFLSLIGSSGSGKSSLLRAGVIPALRRGAFKGSNDWLFATMRPGANPVQSLGRALADAGWDKASASNIERLAQDMLAADNVLHLTVRETLRKRKGERVVLAVDQFEEVFTLANDDLCKGGALQSAFIRNLLYAATVPLGETIVLLTMRADFYGRCVDYVGLASAVSDNSILVGPLSEDELRRAIERPAKLCGCEFDSGLVDLLINDVNAQPGLLPLLEHTLLELWLRREGGILTHAAYISIGRLRTALEKRANDVYTSLADDERELCRMLFLRLVHPGEFAEDTKRRVRIDELLTIGETRKVRSLIERLADPATRLLVMEGGGTGDFDQAFVEVVHEALIQQWSQLRNWIEADRNSLRTHRRLTEASREWTESGQKGDFLLSGSRLMAILEWSGRHSAELNDVERQFVETSIREDERKKVDEERSQHLALLDKAQDAIFVLDIAGRISYLNKGAESLYECDIAEAVQREAVEIIQSNNPEEFRRVSEVVLSSGEWRGESEHLSRTGRPIKVESRWSLVNDELGMAQAILVINTDITEKKKLEEQLRRSQRMESLGTLVGGIAHDINNVLAQVLMAASLLKVSLSNSKQIEIVEVMEASASRGAQMISQLLSFARGKEGTYDALDLRDVVADVERVIADTFPKNIRLQIPRPAEVMPVSGDETQLHQVLLNLCVNARDAMPDGGILEITQDLVLLNETDSQQIGLQTAGSYIRLTVRDEGIGIPEENREQIFDPFFTTKELGKGTGLGLSTVIAIVKGHGGAIRVVSEVGQGASFQIYLPAGALSQDVKAVSFNDEVEPGKGEMILLVDDEGAVSTIGAQILESGGYKVITAKDGAEAVAVFAQYRDEIDLVVTDLMMPVMDGPTAIRVLRRMKSSLKILACSGLHSAHPVKELSEMEIPFLPKPYTRSQLLSVVKALITRS